MTSTISPNKWHETSSADFAPSDPAKSNILDIFPPQAEPKTELGRYRLLSPTAAVRVSPICLGGMSLGEQWTGYMSGSLNQAQSEELLDAFYKAGGNFIDTANSYHDTQSEHIIGEWMEKRGIRDEIVLATKYTTYDKNRQGEPFPGIGVNYIGNSKKSLRVTLDAALKRLRTDYVDLLYVHWWDHSTSIAELMLSLNDMVKLGKVLYLGISDTPAWVVSQANEYARQNGLAQFAVYQGHWNLGARDMERDIIPMCRNNGMSIAPYGVLGAGKFKTPEELKKRASLRAGLQPTEQELQTAALLQEVAEEIGGGIHPAHVAFAWARQMMTDCYPILGGTSLEHLKSNIEALKIVLTPQQMKKLNEGSPFNHGFPTARFGLDPRLLPNHEPEAILLKTGGIIRYPAWP